MFRSSLIHISKIRMDHRWCLLLLLASVQALDPMQSLEEEDNSDWVDPHDMFRDPQAQMNDKILRYKDNLAACLVKLESLESSLPQQINDCDPNDRIDIHSKYKKDKDLGTTSEEKLAGILKPLIKDKDDNEIKELITKVKELDEADIRELIKKPEAGDAVVGDCSELQSPESINICKEHKSCLKENADLDAKLRDCNITMTTKITLDTFVRRFTRQFIRELRKFHREELGDNSFDYMLKLTLSNNNYEAIQLYAETDMGMVQDVFAALGDIEVIGTEQHITILEWLQNDIVPYITIITQLSLIVLAVLYFLHTVRLSLTTLSIRVVVLCIFASFPWNFWLEYKKKLAQRHASLLQDLPTACRPQDMAAHQLFFQAVKSAFVFSTDECAKYHEQMYVDPIQEVNPGEVIVLTISRMTVEPLKHIGPAFGSLIKGIFQDMPLHMYPIALGCFMVIFIVILIMTCGYSINFMHLITIHAPARREPAPIVPPPQNNRLLYEGDVVDRVEDVVRPAAINAPVVPLQPRENIVAPEVVPLVHPEPLHDDIVDNRPETRTLGTATVPVPSIDRATQTRDITESAVDPGQTIDNTGQTVDNPGQTVDNPGQTVDNPWQTVDTLTAHDEDFEHIDSAVGVDTISVVRPSDNC